MGLMDRIRANACKVQDCGRERADGAEVCRSDLPELWHNRLARQDDGTFLRRRAFVARDETWRAA